MIQGQIWRIATARRSGAEFPISLHKRRVWFADEPQTGTGNTSDGTGNTGESQPKPDNPIPYARFKEVNDAKLAAEAKVKQFEDAAANAAREEALKKGEYDKVIDQLRPKAERVDALEATLKVYLDKEVAEIPEDMRSLIPQGDVAAQLQWVVQAKSAGLFGKPTPTPLDGGKRGAGGGGSTTGGQPVKLDDMQREMAKIAGMSPEDYAKFAAMRGQPAEPGKDKT